MTIITVTAPLGRFTSDQRSKLATTLTDAVLVPEVGQHAPAARIGFQVHFVDLPLDGMAIGGILLSEKMRDIMVIDIAVMDGDWRKEVRAEVIRRIFTALTEASGLPAPSPTWWQALHLLKTVLPASASAAEAATGMAATIAAARTHLRIVCFLSFRHSWHLVRAPSFLN